MQTMRPVSIWLIAGAIAFALPARSYADISAKMTDRLRVIENQLDQLEKSQNETLAGQEGIVKQLEDLKIYVNKFR